MILSVLLGVFLLLVAALDVWASWDPVALARNPGAAWLVQKMGVAKARTFLFCVAAFLAMLGIVQIVSAVQVVTL